MFFSADDEDQDFLSPGGSVQCQVYLKSYNLLKFQILGGGSSCSCTPAKQCTWCRLLSTRIMSFNMIVFLSKAYLSTLEYIFLNIHSKTIDN